MYVNESYSPLSETSRRGELDRFTLLWGGIVLGHTTSKKVALAWVEAHAGGQAKVEACGSGGTLASYEPQKD